GLFEVATGKRLWKVRGPQGYLQAVSFSPGGKHVAVGSVHESIRILESTSGKEEGRINTPVFSLAYSPDGSQIAFATNTHAIVLWDVRGKKEICRLIGHGAQVESLVFSQDGNQLVSGGKDGLIRLWDLRGRKLIHDIPGHDYHVLSLAYMPDGR